MAPKKKRPGERRRSKAARKRDRLDPDFKRPVEWARQELSGVKSWIERLEGIESELYPEAWRDGQLRHYRARAKQLRAEIRDLVRQAKEVEKGPGSV